MQAAGGNDTSANSSLVIMTNDMPPQGSNKNKSSQQNLLQRNGTSSLSTIKRATRQGQIDAARQQHRINVN